jgi:tetratricopeptide (TPR) repeat protein
MTYSKRFLTFILFGPLIACSSPEQAPLFEQLPEDVQTISLLGDTLKSNGSLPYELSIRIDSLIELNRSNGDLASANIWQARLLGYLGEYRDAVSVLSEGLESELSNQEQARFLRHRGHRYITLREFDLAIADFERAAILIEGTEDRVEEDGLPNAQNKPLSSLHTNIWYHLGLAQYLRQDYESAVQSYENCYQASTNDDMRVAALYWKYMSLRKLGRDGEAGSLLDRITDETEVIENDSYLKLLMVFKGVFEPGMLLDEESDALSNATVGYGIGFWHDVNGRNERAQQIWQDVYDAGNWAAFGYIASEVELKSIPN